VQVQNLLNDTQLTLLKLRIHMESANTSTQVVGSSQDMVVAGVFRDDSGAWLSNFSRKQDRKLFITNSGAMGYPLSPPSCLESDSAVAINLIDKGLSTKVPLCLYYQSP
jgi:hypothetical protein